MNAVLFDAGDTLIRVRGSVGEVYARVAAQHGVNVDPTELEARFRSVFPQSPPLCFPGVAADELAQREYQWWEDVVRAVFAEVRFSDFDAFFHELFEYFARAESWELFADVVPALQQLRVRGLKLAIISNFDARLFDICDGLGISSYFDAVVISSRAGYVKPDARIFAVALDLVGVAAKDALHVGDSAREDVAGARAAGLRAIQIQRGSVWIPPDGIRDLYAVADLL